MIKMNTEIKNEEVDNVNYGRRKTDVVFSEVVGTVVNEMIEKRVREILSGDMMAHVISEKVKEIAYVLPKEKPVEVRIGNKLLYRRPRRTRKVLRESFKKALTDTITRHPEWTVSRARRYAKNLVRLYKF